MKKLVTLMLLIFSLNMVAQSKAEIREKNTKFAVTLTQDGKLTFYKDDAGNEPITLDLTLKMEWRPYSTKTGYFSLIPNIEHSNLAGGKYFSYGVWIGYTFDEWIELPTFGMLNEDFIDIDVMPYAGYNIIHRKWAHKPWRDTPDSYGSTHIGLEITFKVHKKVGIVWDFKYNDRTDQKSEFPIGADKGLSFNFAYGIKYEF